jgi:uncharacterized membrane protein
VSPARLRWKTRIFTAIVVLANVLGNFSMGFGLKSRAVVLGSSVLAYLEVFLNPWIWLGIGLLILWMLSRMALLSWADLTYVLPVTSIGYVLTAVIGAVFLGERVSPQRWLGTLLIVAGTALVGSTSIRSREPARDQEPEVCAR